jgi:two-component system, OmpR family, sensor histidine kinase CiaH
MVMFRSATAKLVLWYTLMFFGLSLVFSGVWYVFAREEVSEGLNHQYQQIEHTEGVKSDGDYIGTELSARSASLVLDLLYFNGLVLVLAGAGSYILARRTLAPIIKAHEAQVNFTSEASHELRTPLAAIRADTEATLMDVHSTKTQMTETLRRNLEDVERLEGLSNSLIELARASLKGSETCRLDGLVADGVKRYRPIAENNGITLSESLVRAEVEGDPRHLDRLFTAVLDNAIKYTKRRGSVRVSMALNKKDVVVEVEDTGIGVSKDDLDHVFERFYRARSVRSEGPGYGLGLATAKEIAEAHGGSIGMKSKVSQGTVVKIRLPRVI